MTNSSNHIESFYSSLLILFRPFKMGIGFGFQAIFKPPHQADDYGYCNDTPGHGYIFLISASPCGV